LHGLPIVSDSKACTNSRAAWIVAQADFFRVAHASVKVTQGTILAVQKLALKPALVSATTF
jgi:hypothetical protein